MKCETLGIVVETTVVDNCAKVIAQLYRQIGAIANDDHTHAGVVAEKECGERHRSYIYFNERGGRLIMRRLIMPNRTSSR